MKKITIITMALFSVNFLFAFEKNDKTNFLSPKTNDFVLNNNLLNPEFKAIKKHGRGGDDAFAQGKIIISAGYGFGNFTKSLFKIWTTEDGYKFTSFGPIHFKAEYGISDKIGMGLSVNYISCTGSFNYDDYDTYGNPVVYTYEESFTSLSFLARMNLHFATSEKLDPYWGVGVGYRTGGWKETTNDPYSSGNFTFSTPMPLGFETTMGLRYYIAAGIGLYVEAGFAKSVVQGGLVVAF